MARTMSGSTHRVKLLTVVVAVAICAGLIGAGGASADPGALAVAYQIDVAHSGVQTDAALSPPFSRRWSVTLPAQVSYPLIAEGKVFVTAASSADNATRTPVLYALDEARSRTVRYSSRTPATRRTASHRRPSHLCGTTRDHAQAVAAKRPSTRAGVCTHAISSGAWSSTRRAAGCFERTSRSALKSMRPQS